MMHTHLLESNIWVVPDLLTLGSLQRDRWVRRAEQLWVDQLEERKHTDPSQQSKQSKGSHLRTGGDMLLFSAWHCHFRLSPSFTTLNHPFNVVLQSYVHVFRNKTGRHGATPAWLWLHWHAPGLGQPQDRLQQPAVVHICAQLHTPQHSPTLRASRRGASANTT